jgi:two-component system sensor histidine kinase SenX3
VTALLASTTFGLPHAAVYAIAGVVFVVAVVLAALLGRRSGRRALSQRLTALGTRLGLDPPADDGTIETALSYLEQVTGAASEAVAEASSDAIRLRRSLDTLPQGIVLCDENGTVVYRNARANALMTSRHGDALAAQAVTELLEDAWRASTAERTLDLYGPPRRTLTVRALLIDDGRRPLGVIAMIDDVSERRRLEEIRRDFVANVSHELKTPMGALGLLAETLVSEPDPDVAQRLANRIHTEAFRVSRIIDDLLDLSRIESEEAPPREPVLVNLILADAVERVRATADQRGITIELREPSPPVAVVGERRQLVSAMHALLENAITYSYDNSSITVLGEAVEEVPLDPVPPSVGAPPPPPPPPSFVTGAEEGPRLFDAEEVDAQLAMEHTPAGGTVAVAVEDPEPAPSLPSENGGRHSRRTVRLSVIDHGIGIPSRDLDRIFERFYRVDHGRSRDTGGTGLGLSIVRHVANNHQGSVEVDSREGEGSTFTLVLPLMPDRNP